MYKRLLKIIFAHLWVILYWGFLFNTGKITQESPVLNVVTMILLMTLNFLIYTELSNRTIPKRFSRLFVFLSLVPLAVILKETAKYKLLLGLLSILSTGIYMKRFMNYEHVKTINILPISKRATNLFAGGAFIVSLLMIYLFNISSFMINIFYNLIFLIFETFLVLFLKEKEDTFEKIFRLYYLSDYMTNEREEFARTIHDDIIQDIFASRNYLSLKNPDIDVAKDILLNLEKKARNLMKFYQSNLFERASLEVSISTIVDNISSLYPHKKIRTELLLDKEVAKSNDEKLIRLISIISKELINNVYKHSDASYLNYQLDQKEHAICLEIDSDGASAADFKNIKASKRGVLLLNLLIDSNSGTIEYKLTDDILSTKVVLEVEECEDYFIR